MCVFLGRLLLSCANIAISCLTPTVVSCLLLSQALSTCAVVAFSDVHREFRKPRRLQEVCLSRAGQRYCQRYCSQRYCSQRYCQRYCQRASDEKLIRVFQKCSFELRMVVTKLTAILLFTRALFLHTNYAFSLLTAVPYARSCAFIAYYPCYRRVLCQFEYRMAFLLSNIT